MHQIAVIGTAGRDRSKPMNSQLWNWMLADARKRIPKGQCLVSGGAAWADHLAVVLFLEGHAAALTLHLPAPLNQQHWYEGPLKSAASAANFYHGGFSAVRGLHTIGEIVLASRKEGFDCTVEPIGPGYGAMFARNKKVAATATSGVIAYTFGPGDEPADGGTKDTWDMCGGEKLHVSLPYLR